MIAILLKNWSVWVIGIVLAFAGVQTFRLDHAKLSYANLEKRTANRDAERERVHAADLLLARKTESDLAAVADNARKAKDDALQTSNLRIAALTDSLRNRPSRITTGSSSAAPPTGPGQGSTGAGLYREDGVFLAGEAAAAARIGAERDQCVKLYEQARDTMNKYGAEITK